MLTNHLKLNRALLLSFVFFIGFPCYALADATYVIKMNVLSGKNKTILLIGPAGNIWGSADVSSDSEDVSLTTADPISSLAGGTLQLVTRDADNPNDLSEGRYFGSVVLSWKGSKRASAAEVYTTFKDTGNSYVIDLGKVSVIEIDKDNSQGYAIPNVASSYADLAIKIKAIKGMPGGTKADGKGSVNAPKNSDSSPKNTAMPGMDFDLDGIPNAFDVDDDNDGILDNTDRHNPKFNPITDITNPLCVAKKFGVFTNLKATDPDLVGAINFYGTGAHKADDLSISKALTNTLVYVFQPITPICGMNAVKYEIKGFSIPYAPADYVEMFSNPGTKDIQWMVGSGLNQDQPSNHVVTTPYTFTSPGDISGVDTFSERVTTSTGATFEYTGTPNFVFVTHPMLESYKVGSASKTTTVQYSLRAPQGSASNRISVASGEKITVNIYRPQRLGLAGEPAKYYDIGQMSWYFDIPNGPGGVGTGPGRCDSQKKEDIGFFDTPVATGPRPKPKLTMTVDIDKCFSAKGMSWSGGNLDIDIQVATESGGNSAQKLYVIRP